MRDTPPSPLEYLIGCSQDSVESYSLSCQNRRANADRALADLLDRWGCAQHDERIARSIARLSRARPRLPAQLSLAGLLAAPALSAASLLPTRPSKGLAPRSLFDRKRSIAAGVRLRSPGAFSEKPLPAAARAPLTIEPCPRCAAPCPTALASQCASLLIGSCHAVPVARTASAASAQAKRAFLNTSSCLTNVFGTSKPPNSRPFRPRQTIYEVATNRQPELSPSVHAINIHLPRQLSLFFDRRQQPPWTGNRTKLLLPSHYRLAKIA